MPGFQFGGGVTVIDRTKLDNLVAPLKTNSAASRLPNKDDDTTEGYAVGSTWIYSGTTYTCTDATDGAAKWANAADFFYFDTWDAAKTELTKADNGSKYKDKFIQIANANGGPPSGTWTNPSAISTPIADGNGAIYKCTTDAGATASIELVQRPPASFRLTKIINDKTEAKPTAAGNYVWNVTPDAGWAVAGANIGDVLNLTGTTWTVRNKFDDSPNVLYVGDANNNSKPATKYRGKWVNDWDGVVWMDTIRTGAELASAINAFSNDTTVYVRTSIPVTITLDANATINPTVVFEDLSRVDFKRKDTTDYTITFARKVTMNGGKFQNIHIVLNGEYSTLTDVVFNASYVNVQNNLCRLQKCEFWPGASYSGTYCVRLSAFTTIIDSCRFDAQDNSLGSLNFITRESGKTCDQTKIINNSFFSGDSGKVNTCIHEASGATTNWNYVYISGNYSHCAMTAGFINVASSTAFKFYWTIIGNSCEYHNKVTNSGDNFNWLFGRKAWGWKVTGNSTANTPVSAVEMNNSYQCVFDSNVFAGINSKAKTDKWVVLFTNTSRVMTASNNVINVAGSSMARPFWLSNTKGAVFNNNMLAYDNGKAPTAVDFVYGGSDSETVVNIGNCVRTSGTCTITWQSDAIAGSSYQVANIYDGGDTY